MSQEFECLKLTMDGLFVSHALLKPLGINRFALKASEEESCTLVHIATSSTAGMIEFGC